MGPANVEIVKCRSWATGANPHAFHIYKEIKCNGRISFVRSMGMYQLSDRPPRSLIQFRNTNTCQPRGEQLDKLGTP